VKIVHVVLFRFTIIRERLIVINWERWLGSIGINREGAERSVKLR
jgi:hypothetical protein